MQYRSNLNPMLRSKFSEDIFNHKYRHDGAETWAALAHTLVEDVCKSPDSTGSQDAYLSKEERQSIVSQGEKYGKLFFLYQSKE